MLQGKFEVILASLRQSARAAEGGEELFARLDAEGAKNIVAIAVPLVNRRRGGAGSLGDGTHGKSFLSSPGTEAAGGFEDTSFKLRISLSGQRVDSAVERISSGPRKII